MSGPHIAAQLGGYVGMVAGVLLAGFKVYPRTEPAVGAEWWREVGGSALITVVMGLGTGRLFELVATVLGF